MKHNKYNLGLLIIWVVVVAGFTSSCKKLNEKPMSFADPANFYKNTTQVESALAGAMNSLWDYWGGYQYAQSVFFNDDQYSNGNLVIENNHGAFLWTNHFEAIKNLNLAIGAMRKGSMGTNTAQAEVDELIAQCRFIRAHNYFMLVRMFGGLPLVTDETPDETLNDMSRSSVADVYALIVEDFKYAADHLPATWPTEKRGRPTSGAAKALLAKAYLTMATYPLNDTKNYENAANYANQVIQEANYSLVADISKLFSLETKYGPEMMWSYNSNYADQTAHNQIYRGWSETGFGFGGWGDITVEPEWAELYPASPRKSAFLLTETEAGKPYTSWGDPRPLVRKFMYDKPEDYDNSVSVTNMPIIRFADVLLIFAEAENMAKGGPTQDAVDAVNRVIDRAENFTPNPLHPRLTTAMTKEAFDTAVINERNLELCFEYDRWFDLIRKRILKQKTVARFQQNFTEADYLFPIPDNEILLNKNLAQNPGYN